MKVMDLIGFCNPKIRHHKSFFFLITKRCQKAWTAKWTRENHLGCDVIALARVYTNNAGMIGSFPHHTNPHCLKNRFLSDHKFRNSYPNFEFPAIFKHCLQTKFQLLTRSKNAWNSKESM